MRNLVGSSAHERTGAIFGTGIRPAGALFLSGCTIFAACNMALAIELLWQVHHDIDSRPALLPPIDDDTSADTTDAPGTEGDLHQGHLPCNAHAHAAVCRV